MERIVAQLNHEGFFLCPAKAYSPLMPNNAIAEFPPSGDLAEHHRWRWNGASYDVVADYRGTQVFRPDGTSYYPESFGPLPEGDSLIDPNQAQE